MPQGEGRGFVGIIICDTMIVHGSSYSYSYDNEGVDGIPILRINWVHKDVIYIFSLVSFGPRCVNIVRESGFNHVNF